MGDLFLLIYYDALNFVWLVEGLSFMGYATNSLGEFHSPGM